MYSGASQGTQGADRDSSWPGVWPRAAPPPSGLMAGSPSRPTARASQVPGGLRWVLCGGDILPRSWYFLASVRHRLSLLLCRLFSVLPLPQPAPSKPGTAVLKAGVPSAWAVWHRAFRWRCSHGTRGPVAGDLPFGLQAQPPSCLPLSSPSWSYAFTKRLFKQSEVSSNFLVLEFV